VKCIGEPGQVIVAEAFTFVLRGSRVNGFGTRRRVAGTGAARLQRLGK